MTTPDSRTQDTFGARGPGVRLDPPTTSLYITVSREQAVNEGLVAPTAEEAAARNARAAERRAEGTEAMRAYIEAKAALDALPDPVSRAVLALHAANEDGMSVVCSHCRYADEMGDREDWPCETVGAVAEVHGIEFPLMVPYLDHSEPYVWREGVPFPRPTYRPMWHDFKSAESPAQSED